MNLDQNGTIHLCGEEVLGLFNVKIDDKSMFILSIEFLQDMCFYQKKLFAIKGEILDDEWDEYSELDDLLESINTNNAKQRVLVEHNPYEHNPYEINDLDC